VEESIQAVENPIKELNIMPKSTKNSGKPWTPSDVKQLKDLAEGNTPTRVIGLKLGRTEGAVSSKASQENISLKPTNQSPYNRKSKKK
jgi:hypothetical protein